MRIWACECKEGGFHIFANNVLIEVVDGAGNPLPEGEMGRILVTLLHNYAFPLIRYEIGDVGVLKEGNCSCGNPLPLLQKVEGRTAEFLLSTKGGFISPLYIMHLIGVVHNPGFIKRYQIIQDSLENFTLKLELEPETPKDAYNIAIENIKQDLRAVLGESSIIEIDTVTSIPASQSGKHLYSINRIKQYS